MTTKVSFFLSHDFLASTGQDMVCLGYIKPV